MSAMRWTTLVTALLTASAATATAPPEVPVQGWLADPSGVPVDGDREMTFELFDAETAGTQLHAEKHAVVHLVRGRFTVYLGTGQLPAGGAATLDLGLFSTRDAVWVQVTVGTDVITPRFRLATTPFAAWANVCGDAARVGGLAAADLALASHMTPWSSIDNVPAAVADGDNDVLGGLAGCAAGQVAKRGAAGWACANDVDTTYAAAAGGGLALAGTNFSIANDAVTGARLAADLSYAGDLTVSGGTPPLRVTSGGKSLDITGTSMSSSGPLTLQGLGATTDVQIRGELRQCTGTGCAVAADQVAVGGVAAPGQLNRNQTYWVCVTSGYRFGTGDLREDNSDDSMLYGYAMRAIDQYWYVAADIRNVGTTQETKDIGWLCFDTHLAALISWW